MTLHNVTAVGPVKLASITYFKALPGSLLITEYHCFYKALQESLKDEISLSIKALYKFP